ncbi:MAG: LON peptidase substrate-binding domain-containing protein [Chthonomonas sp.]|nr:LON peptidase substrate-binding domain-containing protein [Chthonomonas sp.]
MAHLEEMPLFPLHAVLFPYAPMQLHIFEERYREMVRYCTEFDAPFGVVLIRHGDEVGGSADPYLVGTAVHIDRVESYDDGKMDVHVHGERRFRVRKIDESKPYLVGLVEPVTEIECENINRLDALCIRAQEVFRLWVETAFAGQEVSVEVKFPEDPVPMSFLIANYLPIDNLTKQRMLETTDTSQRLADLVPLIEAQVDDARAGHSLYRVESTQLVDWIHPN